MLYEDDDKLICISIGKFVMLNIVTLTHKHSIIMKKTKVLAVCLSLALFGASTWAQSLEQGFLVPPRSAKPYTWWHWMNGNISKEGVTKDL